MKMFYRWMYFYYTVLKSNLIFTGIPFQGYHRNRNVKIFAVLICIISLLHRIRYISTSELGGPGRTLQYKKIRFIYNTFHSNAFYSGNFWVCSVHAHDIAMTHIITPHIYILSPLSRLIGSYRIIGVSIVV